VSKNISSSSLSSYDEGVDTTEVDPAAREQVRVREVMNSPVITGTEDETTQEIAERMIDCQVGSVVIMSGYEPVGIVTDGNIVAKIVAKNLRPSEVRAGDVMSSPLLTIKDEKDVTEAARLMRKKGIKRLGVMDDGKLMGIVSISDIIAVTPEMYAIVAEKARMMASRALGRTTHLAGFCDSCNQWSDDLSRTEGRFLCYDCRTEISSEVPEEEG
jgi:CBS domain-containing protein